MIETTTWGEVGIGNIVRDQKDKLWYVIAEVEGWVRLRPAHGRGDDVSLRRPPPEKPVDVYVPTDEEAVLLVERELGGRLLREIEEREHTIARAANFRVDPVPRKALKLRDHIDWLHGVNVDDVLRRHDGTETKPSDSKTKKASIEELCQAHDEMHEKPDLWPHHHPHFHAPKETA